MKRFEIIKVFVPQEISVYCHAQEPIALVSESRTELDSSQAEAILEKTGRQVLLMVRQEAESFEVRCLSLSQNIRALELIDFVFGQFGIAKGTAQWAQSSVSEVLLSVSMSEAEVADVTEYFLLRADAYFTECDVVEATTYAAKNPEQMAKMKEYEKARVSWAYVKTEDIAPKGVMLSIRTLENDTGVVIESDDDVYIMIGCMGEVYQIQSEKFKASYEATEEPLDIFAQMFEMIPAVERMDDHSYLPIDEIAKICYPKKGVGIFAIQLNKRTRVFGKTVADYFVADSGDYLAMRKDDLQDIYVIRKEVFARTYVEKEEKK